MTAGFLQQHAGAIANTSIRPSLAGSRFQASRAMIWHLARSTVSSSKLVLRGNPMRYAIVIEQAAANYSAYVPDLPGCVATGNTIEEVEEQIREAIAFHLEGLREDGTPVPPASSHVEYVDIAA